MDQCTRGALRPRSDQEPVEPKISIAICASLTDPPEAVYSTGLRTNPCQLIWIIFPTDEVHLLRIANGASPQRSSRTQDPRKRGRNSGEEQ